LVVVAGGSNATSRALEGTVSLDIPVDGVFQVARAGLAPEPVIPAYEPLQHWDVFPYGKGFGFAFSKLYKVKNPLRKVVIVPAAKAKSGLGPDDWASGGELIADLAKRVNLVADGWVVEDCILLWQHGELDVEAGSTTYAADLQAAFAAMKQAAPVLNQCKFLVGGLADDIVATYGEAAERVMRDLQDIPGARFVSAAGLPTTDGTHFTAASQLELGARYFAAK
jgi:hypothetical protein